MRSEPIRSPGDPDAARAGQAPGRRRSSLGDRCFAPLVRVAPRATWARLLWLGVDVAIFNLLLYGSLRSLLLEPLGFTTAAGTTAWIAAFAGSLFVLHGLKPRRGGAGLGGFAVELLLFGSLLGLTAYAASFLTTDKGADFSWLRVEIVKTPLWFAMFVRTCPGFTAAFIAAAALLAWRRLAAPAGWVSRLVPGIAVAAFAAAILHTFLPTNSGYYVVPFSAPLVAFWVLLGCGATVMAFRMAPFVLHTMLIALTYSGFLPVTGLAPEFACAAPACAPDRPNQFGVARLYPAGDAAPDPTFNFLRKMVLSAERAFVSYGPTCGIYAADRESGALRQWNFRGLVRDLSWSPDGHELWATNWMTGDFVAIRPDLTPICSADIFALGITTPWGFVTDPDSRLVYISNVSLPIVAELAVQTDGGQCRVALRRSIDFHASGYTRFTDGAFGLHVDRARDRLYVLVGMLEARFEIGLVEIELSSFTVLRDLRLAAGTLLFPVRGRDTALLPSYYGDAIYEVSLPEMALVRTIEAAPTITAIAQDDRRGLFYATSRTTGELLVIDDARGVVARRFAVGAKPDALQVDPARDQLFLGSGRGLFRVDLSRFWPPA